MAALQTQELERMFAIFLSTSGQKEQHTQQLRAIQAVTSGPDALQVYNAHSVTVPPYSFLSFSRLRDVLQYSSRQRIHQ